MEENIEYKIELKLESGAHLDMFMFSITEHRWIFRNKFVSRKEGKRLQAPILVNDTTLVVDYNSGIPQKCELSMDIVWPEKRGKRFLAGVDVSEGSHLFVQFIYEKQGELYRMKTVDTGIKRRIDLDSLGEGLVKPVDFPFPLKNRIKHEHGVYRVPFLKNDNETAFFEFPMNYGRRI